MTSQANYWNILASTIRLYEIKKAKSQNLKTRLVHCFAQCFTKQQPRSNLCFRTRASKKRHFLDYHQMSLSERSNLIFICHSLRKRGQKKIRNFAVYQIAGHCKAYCSIHIFFRLACVNPRRWLCIFMLSFLCLSFVILNKF